MDRIEIEKEITQEKKSISHIRSLLMVFFVAMLAGFLTFYYTVHSHNGRQMVDASVFDARLQNIENTVPLYEKRMAKLEDDLKQVRTRQETASVAPVVTPVIPEEIKNKIAELEKEVASLKSNAVFQDKAAIANAINLLTSLQRLSNKVAMGKSFADELNAFVDKYGSNTDKPFEDAIAALTPYSLSGIPTQESLLASFDDAMQTITKTGDSLPENAGFWEKLWFNISHLISVRKVDKTQTGTGVEAITGRAEDYLERGETEAAVAEINTLPDATKAAFSAWLDEAQIATLTPSLLDSLEEKVMQRAFSITPEAVASEPPAVVVTPPITNAIPEVPKTDVPAQEAPKVETPKVEAPK